MYDTLLNLNYWVGWKLECLTLCWYPHQKYKICTYPYAINWAWFVKRRLHDDEDVIFVVIGFQILVCFHHSMIDIVSRLFCTVCLVWWPIKSVILLFYFLGKAISYSNVALLLSISDEFFSNKMFIWYRVPILATHF